MKRGDVAVFSVSAGLAAIVIVMVTYSLLVVDRSPGSTALGPGTSTSSLLVVTWGPSLCEVEPSNQGCTSGHVGTLGRTFLLHGLWPQPPIEQFCGVPKRVADRASDLQKADMPSVKLPADVRTELEAVMSDVALMVPHEWYTHGTCSDVKPPVYFGDAIALTGEVRKILDPVFQQAQGQQLSPSTVRDRFDAEFGEAAGERVGLVCGQVDGQGTVVNDVHLSLPPVADLRAGEATLSLADLLARGPTIPAGCPNGRVP